MEKTSAELLLQLGWVCLACGGSDHAGRFGYLSVCRKHLVRGLMHLHLVLKDLLLLLQSKIMGLYHLLERRYAGGSLNGH